MQTSGQGVVTGRNRVGSSTESRHDEGLCAQVSLAAKGHHPEPVVGVDLCGLNPVFQVRCQGQPAVGAQVAVRGRSVCGKRCTSTTCRLSKGDKT